MTYRRETIYPCKFLVGFTDAQREALEVIAERDEKSMAAIVRDSVDFYLQWDADRRQPA